MTEQTVQTNFIRDIIDEDLASGKHRQIVTRFPPEPNGYLHLGHSKSICLNFGLARDYASIAPEGARCHLRFDDTNPTKEEQEYIDAIKEDVRWLGFDWGQHEYYASDYFQQLYDWAEMIITSGGAYVDDQSADQIRAARGSLTQAGTPSPHRNRPSDENLDLLRRMKAGEFPDGAKVLRAKIDMASPNINLRDPVMYRILHTPHPRTADQWCIYPSYDWAHGQSDWLEGVTHSICTLEFEDHRPLYDWFIDRLQSLGVAPPNANGGYPRQIEFARLNVTKTLMSKRFLLKLVQDAKVTGWDDPRMPTLCGARRRGYPPLAFQHFCDRIGVARRENIIDLGLLEHFVREQLNRSAPRRMAVLDPLQVVITNWPAGKIDQVDAVNNPEDPSAGSRKVPFTGSLYIEREDFMEDPPKKFFRLCPGREVRLRYGYFIKCDSVVKDSSGNITQLNCTYDPATRGGDSPDGRKVKATLHWVSADHAIDAEVRLYDHLFTIDAPDTESALNPDSLKIVNAKVEPALADAAPAQPIQFERIGYFVRDAQPNTLAFNRTATLKDTWAKSQQKTPD